MSTHHPFIFAGEKSPDPDALATRAAALASERATTTSPQGPAHRRLSELRDRDRNLTVDLARAFAMLEAVGRPLAEARAARESIEAEAAAERAKVEAWLSLQDPTSPAPVPSAEETAKRAERLYLAKAQEEAVATAYAKQQETCTALHREQIALRQEIEFAAGVALVEQESRALVGEIYRGLEIASVAAQRLTALQETFKDRADAFGPGSPKSVPWHRLAQSVAPELPTAVSMLLRVEDEISAARRDFARQLAQLVSPPVAEVAAAAE